jgi:hypothetical protein
MGRREINIQADRRRFLYFTPQQFGRATPCVAPAAELRVSRYATREEREVDYEYVYRTSRFLHPFEPAFFEAHPAPETAPRGYVEYLTQLGRGTLCHGLTILDPESAKRCWTEYSMERHLFGWIEASGWKNGLFTLDDVSACQLIAKDDENDWFVMCARHGNDIVHLPFHRPEPRLVGGGIPGLISDFSGNCRFPFFEPTCSRRCRCFFNVREGFGADGVERELRALWGSQRLEICFEQNTDPEYRYREVVVQALDAHLQMWFGAKVTRNGALPPGGVCVAVTLDGEWVSEMIRFAERLTIPGGSPPRIHREMGMSCSHGAQGEKYPLTNG